MKLAELCTAYPSSCDAPALAHPGRALPLELRAKLRMQRGWLQASLDSNIQRSANRSGLGLRPYTAGDSLRALSARHLFLQEELLTRTDVSPGRFHVSVLVHCYGNMEFRSAQASASKMQAAWAVAGLLENLHNQQAQKVEIVALRGRNLGEALLQQAARLRRSHFCYVITDMLFDPTSVSASTEELSAALKHVRMARGMVVVVRDAWESPDITSSEILRSGDTIAFAAPNTNPGNTPQDGQDFHGGLAYLENINTQLRQLERELNMRNWNSMWLTPEHEVSDVSKNLTTRLAALRICS
ncbi:MAG: hypothetical protein FJY29_04140 [Betaproteobacteria bacterium]|nr:hypothetical protein [Betaproteobacteria bacterium]